MPPYTNLLYSFNFYLFGLIAIASAIAFVTRKSPVAAALWLVNVLFCLAALFIMLDAPFVGIIQILVYAGAIMVVFLFVIMLLNLGQASLVSDARGLLARLAAVGLGLALVAQLAAVRHSQPVGAISFAPDSLAVIQRAQGAVPPVAVPMFNQYLLAFEVTSVLLLVAIVGAVVIGRRRGEFLGGGSDAR